MRIRRARTPGGNRSTAVATPWRIPRDLLATVAVLCSFGCEPDAVSDARPNLVLIVIDTLRADALTPYGAPHAATPNIARLARAGATFENAVAVSPWTGPSVSSLVTGRYPGELGIHDLRTPLPPEALTLAVRLGRAGYATGAVVSNDIAGPSYGHARGYDYFHFEAYKGLRDGGPRRPAFRANSVTDTALEWLGDQTPGFFRIPGRSHPQRPFFLHVHYTDPHEPYLPPERYQDAALGDLDPLDEDYLLHKRFVSAPPTQQQLQALRASYAGEVAFVDAEIGRLLDALPPNTAVVLTSDHGEEFWEHGSFLHGHSLYEELLRVAVILRAPGVPAGSRFSQTVSQVDIAPSLLELAGLPNDDSTSGRSLLPLARGLASADAADATVFSAVTTERGEWLTARRAEFKLHVLPRTGKLQLFDIEKDPRELRDLSHQRPAVTRELRDALIAWRTRNSVRPPPSDDDRERLEALRSIGYLE